MAIKVALFYFFDDNVVEAHCYCVVDKGRAFFSKTCSTTMQTVRRPSDDKGIWQLQTVCNRTSTL